MNITFITGNIGKFTEAVQVIPGLTQQDIDLDEIQSIDPQVVIAHKLSQARQQINNPVIVEDTSLYLDCLNGLPGPLIKWFMKTIGNEGLIKIANTYTNTKATAKVIIGYSELGSDVKYFDGVITGKIVSPQGENGFGWDPIFQPDGWPTTFAQMTLSEKNGVSMRQVAFRKLKDFLDKKI